MDAMQRKRHAIEHGLLHTWERRGRGALGAEQHRLLMPLLRAALRVTGLRSRGERNARNPVVRRIRLACERLPAGFCGFTLLHLSDLHVDGLVGAAEGLRAHLQALEVDLCVLTGDYRAKVSGPGDDVYPTMARLLSGVNARLGMVGILGNHDRSGDVPAFEHLGVKMLVNAALELRRGGESAWVIGVDDPHYYGCDDLPGALRGVPPHAFKILLVHTPELLEDAAHHGVHLYLCGHTHGGQICLPMIGPLIVNTNCRRQYARGVWRYKQMHGYTSTGVGTSGVPVRFFCRPEIGLIELRCPRHAQDHPACTSSAPTASRPEVALPAQTRRPTTRG
jgi:predicted MPP superfamily phosphohydrolase